MLVKKLIAPPPSPQLAAVSNIDENFFIKNRKTPDGANDGSTSISYLPVAPQNLPSGTNEYDDELPTILGTQLTNPYTIANMTAAYNIWFGTSYRTVPTTDLYVRFEPQNETQLVLLEDSLDLELFDHPLDYEVLQEGDYYIAPTKTIEDLPYLLTLRKNNVKNTTFTN